MESRYPLLQEVNEMIADRIKSLREAHHLTQAELARHLNITRSSVNAWEMGISVPSTQCIIELSHIFGVSTDFLLDTERHACIDISGLSDEDVCLVRALIHHLRHTHEQSVS